jgi:hypothetical protein
MAMKRPDMSRFCRNALYRAAAFQGDDRYAFPGSLPADRTTTLIAGSCAALVGCKLR